MRQAVPTRREFLLRSVALTSVVSTLGVALMALYLAALLRLPGEQWWAFLRAMGVAFAALFTSVYLVNLWLFRPLLEFLDAPEAAGEEQVRLAFRRVTALPPLTFVTGEAWWVLGAAAVALGTEWLAPAFSAWGAGILIAAGTSGGLVVMIFHYFLNKRQLAPLRLALARRVGAPELRAELSAQVGLRTKLLVSVTSVTLVVVVFTLLLADALARRPAAAVAEATRHAYAAELAVSGTLDAAGLARAEALAATLAERAVASELRAQQGVSALVLLFGGLLAVGVSVIVSRDVADTVRALAGEVARVAEGDLRDAPMLEEEDELGALSRSFERMTASLRGTVGSVASAADQVDAAAGRLLEVAADVAGTTTEQVEGIRQAAGSMEAIRGQIDGITGSAHMLSQSVEESSSSLTELGTAGEQLHGTASALNEKVDTVSSSIDRMIESVRRVVISADDLTGAADETASGLQQMAASMGQVDTNAAETSLLSERVIDVAERGRERVRETIQGMEEIRTATEAAEAVIRALSDRVASIGAILGVIDDVAEETNLLALNAAIIAAQAGDQGRAFSVVADEIKELADRVLENTQEIGSLIRGVQQEGRSAAEAMERGVARVQSGVTLAAEAGVALDEITVAARRSGEQTRDIVSAVREQATASGHIVGLMDRVRSRVEQIRNAGIQHERGNEVVRRSALSMREVAQQVRETTREQARGTSTIVRSVERVKDALAEIHQALQRQGGSSAEAADFLEQVHARTRSHDESASALSSATEVLVGQARDLRESIRRFTL
jgi:methyl-accepting chemotaxis protein